MLQGAYTLPKQNLACGEAAASVAYITAVLFNINDFYFKAKDCAHVFLLLLSSNLSIPQILVIPLKVLTQCKKIPPVAFSSSNTYA